MTMPVQTPSGEQQLHDLAFKRLKDRRDFQGHLATYVVVNLFLWSLWLFTSGWGSYPWPMWVSLGWGIGVALNWWGVVRRPITESDISREVDRLRRS